MQRASVNMVKATEELKNCVKGPGCNRYIYIYTYQRLQKRKIVRVLALICSVFVSLEF